MGVSGTPAIMGFPHTIPLRISKDMGSLLCVPLYHKGGPKKKLGVPGITRGRDLEPLLEEEKSWNSSLPFSTMRMRARSRHSCRCKSGRNDCWR